MSHPDRPGHRHARRGAGPAAGPRSRSALKAGLSGFLATLAVVVVIVLAVRAGGSHSGSAAGPASGTGGTGGTASGVTASVRAWASGGGTTRLTTLTRDVGAIDDDSAAGDTVSMGQDCVTFQSHLQAAQIYPAIPEQATQQHWSKALTLLAQAAADCSDGAATAKSSLLTRSAAELRSGSTELDLTTARVNELAGP